MNTPKEKAKELVNKFSDLEDGEMYIGKAKQCALIAIDEIINSIVITDLTIADNQFKYWEKVKSEIEKI
jgi:hypothetical protein